MAALRCSALYLSNSTLAWQGGRAMPPAFPLLTSLLPYRVAFHGLDLTQISMH